MQNNELFIIGWNNLLDSNCMTINRTIDRTLGAERDFNTDTCACIKQGCKFSGNFLNSRNFTVNVLIQEILCCIKEYTK